MALIEPKLYKCKPVTVRAWYIPEDITTHDLLYTFSTGVIGFDSENHPYVITNEGSVRLKPPCYIVQGELGEYWPVGIEFFKAKYMEIVEDASN